MGTIQKKEVETVKMWGVPTALGRKSFKLDDIVVMYNMTRKTKKFHFFLREDGTEGRVEIERHEFFYNKRNAYQYAANMLEDEIPAAEEEIEMAKSWKSHIESSMKLALERANK